MTHPLLARSGLSLDRLASFVAVAEVGGVSTASHGDAVRQSQLSRQLKELEAFFGAALVERRRGAFRLTASGMTLLEIARSALTQLADFERRCAGRSMEVHIGAGESVLVWLLMPRLGPLIAKEPSHRPTSDVAFTLHNLQSEQIVTRLRDGRLDLGILRPAEVVSGFERLALGKLAYALLVPKPTLDRGRSEPLRRLMGRLSLVMLEGGGAIHQALADWAERHRVNLNIRLRCTSLVQAAAAVTQLGLAAVLPIWGATAFAPNQVSQVRLPFLRALEVPLQLVWTRRQAGVRPFMRELAEELARALTPVGQSFPVS